MTTKTTDNQEVDAMASDDIAWDGFEDLRVLDPSADGEIGFDDGSQFDSRKDENDTFFDQSSETGSKSSMASLLHVIEEYIDRRSPSAPLEADTLLRMQNPNDVAGGFFVELDIPENARGTFVSSEAGGRA